MPTLPTVALCMIVKNEASLIVRALNSVLEFADYYLIQDTGSTDGTQSIIRKWMSSEGVNGEVYCAPWKDFAHNRTLLMHRLLDRKDIDYGLMLDADDQVMFEGGYDARRVKKDLWADLYYVRIHHQNLRHARAQMWHNTAGFRYRGVLHEFIEPANIGCTKDTAAGVYILASTEGARNLNPNKYREDAEILRRALEEEKDPFLRARYTFYMANSLHDSEQFEKAHAAYLQRASMEFWVEEVSLSLQRAAKIMIKWGSSHYQIIGTLLASYEACSYRSEALWLASRYCRMHKMYRQAYMFAAWGMQIPRPDDGLFIETQVYDYGMLDEYSICTYWVGKYQESLDACRRLLEEKKIPEEEIPRVMRNAEFARQRITHTS